MGIKTLTVLGIIALVFPLGISPASAAGPRAFFQNLRNSTRDREASPRAARPADRPADSSAEDSFSIPPQGTVIRTEDDAPNAYAIGIGDVLDISVWKNPELSVTVPVRPDGRISVPLLGDIQAAGMTPLALKQTLTDGFKEYVTAPGVRGLSSRTCGTRPGTGTTLRELRGPWTGLRMPGRRRSPSPFLRER